VPFIDTTIPILGPTQLAIFKAVFARSQDWVDLEEMAVAEALDLPAVRASLAGMLGEDDERLRRLDEAARRDCSTRYLSEICVL
jgi:hypothetical protein